MQSLICIRSGKAIVQNKTTSYTDTYENFLLDGGDPLPEGLTELDFNRTLHSCISLGEYPEKAIHEYAERMIEKVPLLAEAFEARKAISDKAETDASFEANEKEAKERAEKEEAERFKKLTLSEYKQERLIELSMKSSTFENNLNQDMFFISALGFKCNGDMWHELTLMATGCRYDNFEDLVEIATRNGRMALGIEPYAPLAVK